MLLAPSLSSHTSEHAYSELGLQINGFFNEQITVDALITIPV